MYNEVNQKKGTGKVLVVNGGGTDVQWSTPAPSGVTSINALTASAQTMGTGTSGAFLKSSGLSIVLNILKMLGHSASGS